MPKLERLDWIEPLSAGHGVTLTDHPEINLFLAESPEGLLIGVLLDSQYRTKAAFASPYYLWERLGHLDLKRIAAMDPEDLKTVFREPNSLHRFPFKFAGLTQRLAEHVSERYDGQAQQIWKEAADPQDLANRILNLPAFGVEKTNWTIGMLGRLEMLPVKEWEDYRITAGKKKASTAGA